MSNALIIKTTCSGCSEQVTVDRNFGVAIAKVPSNGKRGSLHVPAHNVSVDLDGDDGDLVTWDCPWPTCGYADSFDLND